MSRSDRCDPELWAGAVEGPDGSTTHPTFRRGLELAGRRALSSAETGELWLDLGCGTGVLTRSLARAGLRVIAADVDPAMLRFALRASPAAVRPVAADAARLPIADGVCDGVAAVSLVGHFPDPSPLLGECARVLRPSGRLLVTATNRASWSVWLGGLLARSRGGRRAPEGGPARYALHRPAPLAAACRAAGLRPERVTFYGHLPPYRRWTEDAVASAERRETTRASFGDRPGARNFLLEARRSHGEGGR